MMRVFLIAMHLCLCEGFITRMSQPAVVQRPQRRAGRAEEFMASMDEQASLGALTRRDVLASSLLGVGAVISSPAAQAVDFLDTMDFKISPEEIKVITALIADGIVKKNPKANEKRLTELLEEAASSDKIAALVKPSKSVAVRQKQVAYDRFAVRVGFGTSSLVDMKALIEGRKWEALAGELSDKSDIVSALSAMSLFSAELFSSKGSTSPGAAFCDAYIEKTRGALRTLRAAAAKGDDAAAAAAWRTAATGIWGYLQFINRALPDDTYQTAAFRKLAVPPVLRAAAVA